MPKRLARIEKAILEKDFETFGLLTMQVYTKQDSGLPLYT